MIKTEMGSKEKIQQEMLLKRIDNDFTYHRPPTQAQVSFVALREKAKELARLMATLVPHGREQVNALARLEESVMHANAGIARQFPLEPTQ